MSNKHEPLGCTLVTGLCRSLHVATFASPCSASPLSLLFSSLSLPANYPVGLADATPQANQFNTNRAMLMIPKTIPRAVANSLTLLKNPAGLVGGKEMYDAAMAAAKKKK